MLNHNVSRETLKLLCITKAESRGEKRKKTPWKSKKTAATNPKTALTTLNATQKANKNRKMQQNGFFGNTTNNIWILCVKKHSKDAKKHQIEAVFV